MAEFVGVGYYDGSGSSYPANIRGISDPTFSGNVDVGFRPALFL